MKWYRSILSWLLITSSISLFWPVERVGFDPFVITSLISLVTPIDQLGFDPSLITKIALWSAIVLTMFSLGGLVRPEELKPLTKRPWWVVLGVMVQVLVMPFAAWTVTRLVPMEPEMALGIILVGCVPGAMASNVLTNTAGGSVAYSVSLTSAATVLSPLTVPAVLWVLARQETQNSLAQSAVLLATLVTLPTILGYVSSIYLEPVRKFLKAYGSVVASAALLWIISVVIAANRMSLLSVGSIIISALLFVNITGYLAGYFVGGLCRLPASYRRALTLEIGMQNAGLGTALSVSILGAGTTAVIPTAVYTFGCMLTGTVLAVLWQRRDLKQAIRDSEMD